MRGLYGTWSSSVNARMVANTFRLQDVQWDSDGETLVWVESRAGQSVLVMQALGDSMRELTESDMRVKAGIGYGGGDFTVQNGIIVFVGNDSRLYRLPVSGGRPHPITPAFGSAASPAISPDGQWVAYVHSYEDVDGLCIMRTDGSIFPQKFAYGTDFVMDSVWHPTGTHLAYIAWDKPNMPWDGVELRLIPLSYAENGTPIAGEIQVIAGDKDTAVMQPAFSPDGAKLAYLSDKSGWGQLYIYDLESGDHQQITHADADHTLPGWRQETRMFGWSGDGRQLFFLRNVVGLSTLWQFDLTTGRETAVEGLQDYTDFVQISIACVRDRIALLAGSSVLTNRLITLESNDAPESSATAPNLAEFIDTPSRLHVRRRTSAENISPTSLSTAQAITWTGHDGETVHGLYYPPASETQEGIGAPPLIVHVHGGPTSQARTNFNAEIQYFATRGYAVLAVNHRGSTGYGREYMLKHRGQWGYYDVEDSASGAAHLAAQGLADASKLVIMGGSAGGYTVLQSLVAKPGVYKAGVCLYGISNMFTLSMSGADWKFESAYNDMLLGALPEAAALYRERSPIFHADNIVDPVILFQGEDDVVVPRNQSDEIVAALKARGIPHEYHVYAGEGHGWRKPETIEAYLKATERFLMQHVIFA